MTKEYDNKTYLTTLEAQEHKEIRLTRNSLYDLAKEGVINPYRFDYDKKTYWELSELLAVAKRPPQTRELGIKRGKTNPKPQHAIVAKQARVRGFSNKAESKKVDKDF